ncbi:MAG: hypothetical protein IJ017_05580 [Oscillospiraceae bacterium]|nr:hypothetical protein [Oscillospiraceae bacterium]
MSIRQENRKKNIRGLLLTIAAVIVLTAVGFAVVATQNSNAFKERAESFYYSASDDSVFSKVGSGFAVASTSELQVFASDGVQTMQETYIMSDPAMSCGGDNAVLYDIGGNSVKIFSTNGMIQNIKTDGRVISAKMNSKGWTAVCCEETGYQGAVYVYNSGGSLVYKWLSGDGYVFAASVSQDNTYLAVITLGESGSRVVKLKLTEESYKKEYTAEGELLLDVHYNSKGEIFALSDENLYLIKNDDIKLIYNFGEMNLTDYCFGDELILALNEHKTGGACTVVKVLPSGETENVSTHENGVVSLDMSRKYISVLTDSGLYIYDYNDYELTANYEVSACLRVLMYEDGAAAAASRNSAGVYSAKGNEADKGKGK